jgi:hypothetical protein
VAKEVTGRWIVGNSCAFDTETRTRAGGNVAVGEWRGAVVAGIVQETEQLTLPMLLKSLTGILPLLMLGVTAWWLSRPEAGAKGAGGGVAEVKAVEGVKEEPKMIGADEVGEYAAFEFGKVFERPAGPKGLEYTAAARALDGKKVRLTGYMVRHWHDDASVFLFTEYPRVLNVAEYGLADDLPPEAVHVIQEVLPGRAPDWVRQRLVVLGRLELGPRQEQDGRVSQVRLHAERITAEDGRTLVEVRRPVALQRVRVNAVKAATPGTLSVTRQE